ncbi:MAG: Ig-like domain-containing protein, partial [Acutalibacteraceae bacterium]
MSCNNSSCNSDVVSVSSVTVYPEAVNLSPGSYCYDLYAVVKPDNAANRIVIWHSSDTSVAEVDLYSGVVYAKSIGTAKITAVASNGSGISDYCMVNVGGAIPVQSVNFHETDISLEKGTVYVPPVSVCPSNATNKSLAWYTSNTSVATVTDGMIHAKEEGTAVITAVSTDQSNKSSSLTVTVTNNRLVTCVRLRPVSKTLTVGDFMYLECIVCPENALDRTVRWSSSNSDVVSVDQNGRITANAPGNATVFADANDTSGKYGTCYVTVNAAVPVTGISVCPAEKTMNVGEPTYFDVNIYPSDA